MNLRILALTMMSAAISFPVLAKSVSYEIDPTHTATVFSWDHFGFSTPSGNFTDIRGQINYDAAQPQKSSVMVNIPVSSLNTNVVALDNHLKAADFFDATKYPMIYFKSTQVEPRGDKKFKITGDLTIKGITKSVVLDAVLNKQAEHPMKKLPAIGFNATTSFERSAFGIASAVPNVGDKITVNITTEAVQNAE